MRLVVYLLVTSYYYLLLPVFNVLQVVGLGISEPSTASDMLFLGGGRGVEQESVELQKGVFATPKKQEVLFMVVDGNLKWIRLQGIHTRK